LLLQPCHTVGGSVAIRICGLIGCGTINQRIPLDPRLMNIKSGLAVKGEAEQQKA
jgi:hypothetical protein